MALPLSPPVFAILASLIEERAGLYYAPGDAHLLAERASVRAVENGFDSLLDYYYFLRYDPRGEAELELLLESLVVNETYFFRELDQLVCAVGVLEEKISAGATPRVWCAAAASGEEPLTLAMLLEERGLLGKVELIASDVSEAALGRARAGAFSARSLRQLPRPALAARWLERSGNGYRVSPSLVAAIDWRRVNLIKPAEVKAIGRCDVILCRNVLIYFRDDRVVKVVEALHERLVDGGVLFVGVSESLLRFGTALTCEERAGVFLYRKGGLQ